MKAYKDILAITLAIVLFAISHMYLTTYTNTLAQNLTEFEKWHQWLIFLAYSLYFISGAVSASISLTKPIMVSFITGILCTVLAIVLFGVGGSVLGKIALIIVGSISSVVGGLFILAISKLLTKPLTSSSRRTNNP